MSRAKRMSPEKIINIIVFGAICGALFAHYVSSTSLLTYLPAIQSKKTTDTAVEILKVPWRAYGNKSLSEKLIEINPENIEGNNTLRVVYNSYGLCLLEGKAASIALEQDDDVYAVPLSHYGQNCNTKEQTIDIPLEHFAEKNNLRSIKNIRISFWFPSLYTVDMKSVRLTHTNNIASKNVLGKSVKITSVRNIHPTFILKSAKRSTTPTIDITSIIPGIPSTSDGSQVQIVQDLTAYDSSNTLHYDGWLIKSVSSMKETKDRICTQNSEEFIEQWVDKAKKLGANYISVETPYDSPECGDSVAYTKLWIQIIRSRGLHVWHRHMPITFEGLYGTKKVDGLDYLAQIKEYIRTNKDDFKENDIFTPIPEPQNGGISGVTHCPQNVCQFSNPAHFNRWLRASMDAAENTFAEIGLEDKMNVGFFGFDGFVVWGDNNPDWDGILEDRTIARMGNITIDHYPEVINGTMEHDLDELQAKYPNVPIVIGEWGTIAGDNPQKQVTQTMKAAKRPNVIGFNYWHMGMGGNEALINADFSEREHFSTVQSFYLAND